MNRYIKLSQYAKFLGLSYRTVWSYFKNGKIEGFQDESTGTIFVLNPDFTQTTSPGNRAILYARVSSTTNKASLDGQIERLSLYATAKGYQIIDSKKEIASGLNENRKQLNNILNRNDFDILIVEHKDRLTRFGANYIEKALLNNNQRLEIINKTEEKDIEIMDDFISIVTSFCGRIYGAKRKAKTAKIIEEIIN